MVTECSTAKEFIGILTDEKYSTDDLRWLFRGIKDASFPLVPASHRKESPWPFGRLPATVAAQVSAEFHAISRFYQAAHREGLPIPDWANTTYYLRMVKQALERTLRWSSQVYWPDPAVSHLIAIAQHHGTPTRFLDWTRDALVAAYFAVPHPADGRNPDDAIDRPIAVWILDTDQLSESSAPGGLVEMRPLRESSPSPIIEIPYDLNKNARAQRGVFLNYLQKIPLNPAEIDQPLPSPESLDKWLTLERVTLPGAEAPALLRELHHRKIDGAALFPGYLGASRAERERLWWDR